MVLQLLENTLDSGMLISVELLSGYFLIMCRHRLLHKYRENQPRPTLRKLHEQYRINKIKRLDF
jgi:hypothetical protein